MRGVRLWATITAGVVALLAAIALALAFTAPPASAYSQWAHDGATGCVCHDQGTPTDATCTACHTGFQSYPGMNCWSCHAPGQDTSTLSSPSSACSQECHLWDSAQKLYLTPTTHGTNPHIGSSSACLECHPTSVNIADPGSSPHHQGTAPGFTQCGVCHSQQKHDGKVACTQCHANATAFHLYQASSPGFKKCGSCHAMRHAGVKIAASKCAGCHKGSGTRPPQHSSSITKKFVCSGCHSNRLHASAVSRSVKNCRTCHAMRHAGVKIAASKCAGCHKGSGSRPAQHSSSITRKSVCGGCHSNRLHASAVSRSVKNCRTCHGGKYHARQTLPSRTVCTRCHATALRHSNGFQCTLCHRRAVHNPRPSAIN